MHQLAYAVCAGFARLPVFADERKTGGGGHLDNCGIAGQPVKAVDRLSVWALNRRLDLLSGQSGKEGVDASLAAIGYLKAYGLYICPAGGGFLGDDGPDNAAGHCTFKGIRNDHDLFHGSPLIRTCRLGDPPIKKPKDSEVSQFCQLRNTARPSCSRTSFCPRFR